MRGSAKPIQEGSTPFLTSIKLTTRLGREGGAGRRPPASRSGPASCMSLRLWRRWRRAPASCQSERGLTLHAPRLLRHRPRASATDPAHSDSPCAGQMPDQRPARRLHLDVAELVVAAGNVDKRRIGRADHACAGAHGEPKVQPVARPDSAVPVLARGGGRNDAALVLERLLCRMAKQSGLPMSTTRRPCMLFTALINSSSSARPRPRALPCSPSPHRSPTGACASLPPPAHRGDRFHDGQPRCNHPASVQLCRVEQPQCAFVVHVARGGTAPRSRR